MGLCLLPKPDGRTDFKMLRMYLQLITGVTDDILDELADVEKLVPRAEERTGPPAALFVIPDRKESIQSPAETLQAANGTVRFTVFFAYRTGLSSKFS